jgi:methyl-accepting chemotaxis protein
MHERRSMKSINRSFQRNFMLKTVLSVVISLNLIIFTVYMLDRYFGFPGSVFNVFSISLLIMEIFAVGVVAWIGRDISFHVTGPVYAIERTLKDMAKGDVSHRLTLREGDNFLEAADTLNMVLETYQNRVEQLKSLVADDNVNDDTLHKLREELDWFVTQKPREPASSKSSIDELIIPTTNWRKRSA